MGNKGPEIIKKALDDHHYEQMSDQDKLLTQDSISFVESYNNLAEDYLNRFREASTSQELYELDKAFASDFENEDLRQEFSTMIWDKSKVVSLEEVKNATSAEELKGKINFMPANSEALELIFDRITELENSK